MPLPRATLEDVLARVNRDRRPGSEVQLAAFSPRGFTLAFVDAPMPEGHCLDEHFVEIQFLLHEAARVDTGIVGARYDEAAARYLVEYEVVEWA